jgi:hypothetical protein
MRSLIIICIFLLSQISMQSQRSFSRDLYLNADFNPNVISVGELTQCGLVVVNQLWTGGTGPKDTLYSGSVKITLKWNAHVNYTNLTPTGSWAGFFNWTQKSPDALFPFGGWEGVNNQNIVAQLGVVVFETSGKSVTSIGPEATIRAVLMPPFTDDNNSDNSIEPLLTINQPEINCNTILACNDGVQISMDDDCKMLIEPDMILEAPAYGDEAYDVEAKMLSGMALPQITVGTDYLGRPIRRVELTSAHVGRTLEVKISLRGCGNSCWGTALIEDKLPPVNTTMPCEARITNFTGNLSASDNSYDRPDACPGADTDNVRYETRTFAVDANGTVDIALPQANAKFALYAGSFDPTNPCAANMITTNASSYSGNLVTGATYTLVISSTGSATPSSGISYTVYLDSKTGNVKSSTTATVCTVECTAEAAFLAQTATNAPQRPGFQDGCAGPLTYEKFDFIEVLSCTERFSKIITRTWTATDQWGNKSEVKTQYFYIKRGSLDNVSCPNDWTANCSATFSKLPNGAPIPSVSGMPSNTGCQNIQVYYDDIIFDLCGAGFKVYRQWFIIDWCTGQDKICNQILKVEDDIDPTLTCPTIPVLPTDHHRCAADWQVTPPSSVDCSLITWEVFFSKDGTNLPSAPGSAIFVKNDATTSISGSVPPFASRISSTDRPYTIQGLPLGKTWIKYRVVDECGNVRECTTSITVEDKTPPTAICEDQTVISLDDSGWAELFAESLDNHSLDNCSPVVKYEVRRKSTTCAGFAGDLVFGPKVNFCCSDITAPVSYVRVVLRVFDAAGNFNECETDVKVQNKRLPAIACPGNKTLTCGDARIAAWASGTQQFDTTFFGKPVVTGVCTDGRFASRITNVNINNKCNTGTVTREWFLVSNPTVRCSQTLSIVSPSFSPANVTFPPNLELATCNINLAHPDITGSVPVVHNLGCRDIGISYEDQVFHHVPDVCIKIVRTWRVIDWCTYPNTQVIATHAQTIKFSGSGGAVFSGCTDQNLTADAGKCDKEVTMTANATDECTNPEDLVWSWSLDLFNNGTADETGNGKSVTRILPAGTHKVMFSVTNRCWTTTSCMYRITIRPNKKPTPICLGEVVWVMDSDGSTDIWASDFNLKSVSNCGDDSKLKFSFNPQGNQTSRRFTCADIPNGQVARIPLKMYVIDEFGNSDFCDVVLILQDSPLTNACQDNNALLPAVAGKITTEMSEGIENIEVELKNMSSSTAKKEMTRNNGDYLFTGVDVFDPKSIGAYKDSDLLNGVSTLDLVLIQRHILGIQKITSPYKLLAADINNSRSITASDLVALRKNILGVTTTFDNNTSWRFVPASYVFPDPASPFDFPSRINLDSIFEDKSNVNFTAVKVGDVNNSAKANATSIVTESRSAALRLTMDDVSFDAGKTISLPVRATEDLNLIGTQFALAFDPSVVAFTTIRPGVLDIKAFHMNEIHAAGGKVYVSMDAASGVQIREGDVLFTIEFRSLSSGKSNVFGFDNQWFASEMYDNDASARMLELTTDQEVSGESAFMLFQNKPNPFKDETSISFSLEASSEVVLRIMDVTGRIVLKQSGKMDKGFHKIQVNAAMLGKTGVFYYQIEASGQSATKKMILIE